MIAGTVRHSTTWCMWRDMIAATVRHSTTWCLDSLFQYFQKILPSDYDYKLCDYIALDSNDQFLVTLRMSLTCKEEALEWKHQFEEKSLTTHVLDKSFPKVGRVSVFKVNER